MLVGFPVYIVSIDLPSVIKLTIESIILQFNKSDAPNLGNNIVSPSIL